MTRTLYLHGFASGPGSQKARFFEERFAAIGERLEVLNLVEGEFEDLTLSGQLAVIERAVKDEPVNLIGSSMGGYLAALFGARHPEVEKLVLLAPAFSFMTRWAEQLGGEAMLEWKTTGRLSIYHYGEKAKLDLGYQLAEDARGFEDYPNFPQPALIIHGRGDTVVPPEYSITFTEQHQKCKLHLVDSDHELLNVLDFIWAETEAFLTGAAGTEPEMAA